MKCSICGKGELVRDTRAVPYTYKGQKTLIKNIHGEYCTRCGMGYYGPDDDPDDRLMAGMRAFREKVDAVLAAQAKFVEDVRKKLGLDQHEAGEIFGGGHNAFSRYETGKTRTPVSVLQLLTLLDDQPELLHKIRERRHRLTEAHEFREKYAGQEETADAGT
jgi:HTH-type transcriptional regulator/antitoxin MqsA